MLLGTVLLVTHYMLWRHRGLQEVLILKMSKETNFYLNTVFIIDSVSKLFSGFKLSLELFDGDAWLSNIKKTCTHNHCQNFYFLTIFPLDDYHLFNLIFESSFKNTIS